MQKLDNKTRFEALQLGAATNIRYDQLIKDKKLPYDWYWTRTMVAYEKPGVPFGKTASFTISSIQETWQITIPKKYQGKANLVILADLSQNEAKKDGDVIVLSPKKIVVKQMPKENGWYLPDEMGFPSGEKSNIDNENARKLYRRDNSFIGLLSRGCYVFGGVRRYVSAGDGGGSRLGVVIDNENKSGVKTDIKLLAKEAEKAIDKMRGKVKEELLAPIEKLVEAAKQ